MTIQKLEIPQLEKLYHAHMEKDFVPQELRPWHSVKHLTEQGCYATFACREEGQLVAYAAFARCEAGVLLDYFAVVPQLRGKGVGSRFFRELKGVFPQFEAPCIFIEVESLESASSPEEREVRRRRIQFYQRCGCEGTPIFAHLFGVEYQIMTFPLEEGPSPSLEELEAALLRLYQVIIPRLEKGEGVSKVCRIYRREKPGI